MPNKRSNRGRTKKFFCPHCQLRLWRGDGTKHHLFYLNASQVKQNTGIPRKKAEFIIRRSATYLDTKRWIESFFCPEHGSMWLLIDTRSDCTDYTYQLAKREDWLQTNRTIDPRTSNPSVSEFTLNMSRNRHSGYR